MIFLKQDIARLYLANNRILNRLDNAVQELSKQKAELDVAFAQTGQEAAEQLKTYQIREKELSESLQAHQAELEKSQKQTIELAESLR